MHHYQSVSGTVTQKKAEIPKYVLLDRICDLLAKSEGRDNVSKVMQY
jgi:hypothetical protein